MNAIDLKAPLTLIPNEDWDLESATALFFALNLPDGFILTHAQIAALIGVPLDGTVIYDEESEEKSVYAFDRLNRFDKFKERLLFGHSVYLKNVRGIGYKIIPPADQASVATEDLMKEMNKAFERAGDVMRYTRLDKLSNIERKNHTDSDIKLKGFDQMMKAESKKFKFGS